MSRPFLRSGVTHSAAVTPIYFHHDAVAPTSTPEPAPAAPQPHTAPKPDTAQQATTEAQADAGSAAGDSNGDEQGLAPFPTWRMNSSPMGLAGMYHHAMKNALPVFTPDPPVLHAKVPDFARGKDVVLEVVIDEKGSIVQASILQGVGNGVENSIMETLRRWIYVPAKINGYPISSHQQLRFHLPG